LTFFVKCIFVKAIWNSYKLLPRQCSTAGFCR